MTKLRCTTFGAHVALRFIRKKKHFTFLFFITTSVLKSSEKHLQIFNLTIAAGGGWAFWAEDAL